MGDRTAALRAESGPSLFSSNRPLKVDIPGIDIVQDSPREVSVFDVSSEKTRLSQISISEVSVLQVGLGEIALSKASISQISPLQVSIPHFGEIQPGISENSTSKISSVKYTTAQFGLAKVNTTQVSPAQINTSKAQSTQIGPAQINFSEASLSSSVTLQQFLSSHHYNLSNTTVLTWTSFLQGQTPFNLNFAIKDPRVKQVPLHSV